MAKPKLETLEARDVPATPWADAAPFREPGTFEKWVPEPGGVEWFVSAVTLPDGRHDVLFAGEGGGARVVIVSLDGSGPVLDRVFFDPDAWRSGVGEVESVGSTLYVTPGVGAQLPGPVYGKIDLLTGEVGYYEIPGFDPDWRGGTRIATTDVEWTPGGGSTEPGTELVFLPGGTDAVLPGNVFFLVNAEDDTLDRAVGFGDQTERRRWEFAPAVVGTTFPDGTTGMVLQPLGVPVTDGRAEGAVAVRWDGVVVDFPGVV